MAMVGVIMLKPFPFYFMSVVSLGKMSGTRAPVNPQFCHHGAVAGVVCFFNTCSVELRFCCNSNS